MSNFPSSKLFRFLKAVVCFSIIAVVMIWFVHLEKGILQIAYIFFVLIFDLLCVHVILHKEKYKFLHGMLKIAGVILLLVILAIACIQISYSEIGAYSVKPMESGFFRDKHVMVIVPHQDDDINLMGGAVEQYTAQGSRVSIVFTTNGDNIGMSETRICEALNVAQRMGVPQNDVYFLGFGDAWQPLEADGKTYGHIYNSPDDKLQWTSYIGYQETYGTSFKDCYKPYAYTRENHVDSMRSLILELRPDVIYAVDYDHHVDHRAASLFFEEAMASILRSVSDYKPKVYKGFCYRTAWFAGPDFIYGMNIDASAKPDNLVAPEVEINQYPWENRVRLPVMASGLNRFISQTEGYKQLALYRSQAAETHAANIINGDKVFWERRTDGLLYGAEIFHADERITLLNDFKLMDTSDVCGTSIVEGIVPVQDEICVQLPNSEDVRVVALYDDPGEYNQILSGFILVDDGTEIPFGALNNNGAATYISIPESVGPISSFEVHVKQSQGTPGLTEIDAFSQEVPQSDMELQYFVFTDEDDNFVYDYCIHPPKENLEFTLYTYPLNFEVRDEDFQITMSGSKSCSYTFEDGKLRVHCPQRAKCQFEIRYGDLVTNLSVSNPGAVAYWLVDTLRQLDYEMVQDEMPFGMRDQIRYYKEVITKIQMKLTSILE